SQSTPRRVTFCIDPTWSMWEGRIGYHRSLSPNAASSPASSVRRVPTAWRGLPFGAVVLVCAVVVMSVTHPAHLGSEALLGPLGPVRGVDPEVVETGDQTGQVVDPATEDLQDRTGELGFVRREGVRVRLVHLEVLRHVILLRNRRSTR